MLRIESTNNIPNIFHLFWAGSKMPDHAVYNLYSFLNHLPADGKVHFWVTDPNCLYKSNAFQRLDIDLIAPATTHYDMPEETKASPVKSRLVIKDIRALLNSAIFDELDETKGHGLSAGYNFKTIRQIIERELVGKGNPVVAKDCFIPLCLYSEGGYYFDLDYQAVSQLTPPPAEFGILLNAAGINPSCFASEKESRFLLFALVHLIKNYETVPDIIKAHTKKSSPHMSTYFLNLEQFRDRSNPLRSSLTCITSGAILHPALKDYAKSLDLAYNDAFLNAVNFASQPGNAFLLTMGVKHLKPEELVYQKPKQPEVSNLTKCFQAFFCCCTKRKKPTATPAPLEQDVNWRNKKAPNRNFEAEDIILRRK